MWERVRDGVLAELRENFRPEFLNRVDDIILFSRLDRTQLREIVDIQLRGVRDRLAARKLTLHVTDAAIDALAAEGYDPTYGARPLKRVIQRRLQDPIAMAILEGRFSEGDTIDVDAKDGQITISARGAEPVAGGLPRPPASDRGQVRARSGSRREHRPEEDEHESRGDPAGETFVEQEHPEGDRHRGVHVRDHRRADRADLADEREEDAGTQARCRRCRA